MNPAEQSEWPGTKLGIIVPSTNSTVEPELQAIMPSGHYLYVTRVLQQETNRAEDKVRTVLAMRAQLPAAANLLAGLSPAAIAFACTAATFLEGAAEDRRANEELTNRIGIATFSTSRALVWATRSLGFSAIALATPYLDEIADREAHFLRTENIDPVGTFNLGIVGNLPKGRLGVSASMDAARQADAPRAEAVIISCTNWPTLAGIDRLTDELGKPVVSSNSATGWALLRIAGFDGPVACAGALAEVGLPADAETELALIRGADHGRL